MKKNRKLSFLALGLLLLPLTLLAEDFDWKSEKPIRPPDFEGYFTENAEAGKRLDELMKARKLRTVSDKECLEITRKGLRSMSGHRTLVLRELGNRFIWNTSPQNAEAIELMYHASGNPNHNERHYAIYFGLSVTKPKPPAILKALADISMTTDDFNTTGRIAWGSSDQKEALIRYLKPYLKSEDPEVKRHAEAMEKVFNGTLKASKFQNQNFIAKATPEFAPRLGEFRKQLETGNSEKRLEILKLISKHRLNLIFKDQDAWFKAYEKASSDPDPDVREQVAVDIGSQWIWRKESPKNAAIDVMLMLAEDDNKDVAYDAFYYGLNRLPKDHPVQQKVKVLEKQKQRQQMDEMKKALMIAISKGEYEQVEHFLESIKPNPNAKKETKEMTDKLYQEVSKRLEDAQSKNSPLRTQE